MNKLYSHLESLKSLNQQSVNDRTSCNETFIVNMCLFTDICAKLKLRRHQRNVQYVNLNGLIQGRALRGF
jgi:hypothetical protein